MKLQEFIDANPWLEKCKNDLHDWRETTPSFWWDGAEDWESCEVDLFIDTKSWGFNIEIGDVTKYALHKYFRDWKSPTKQENEMFAMLYGHPLPWSEEQPFVWEERCLK